jgi:hypothetical protein
VDNYNIDLISMARTIPFLIREMHINLEGLAPTIMRGDFGGYDPNGDPGNRDALGRFRLHNEMYFLADVELN